MKTTCFGFGSTTQATHLNIRRNVFKNALTAAGPALCCLLVTACAVLQPYSMQGKSGLTPDVASADGAVSNNDTCEFGDMNCIARQSEIQTDQADFLARQYPVIVKNAQRLESCRTRLRGHALPEEKARFEELGAEVRIMTQCYNFNAAHTEPTLLTEKHLPEKIVPSSGSTPETTFR